MLKSVDKYTVRAEIICIRGGPSTHARVATMCDRGLALWADAEFDGWLRVDLREPQADARLECELCGKQFGTPLKLRLHAKNQTCVEQSSQSIFGGVIHGSKKGWALVDGAALGLGMLIEPS